MHINNGVWLGLLLSGFVAAQDIPTFAFVFTPGRDASGRITATASLLFGPGLTPAIVDAPFSADHTFQLLEKGTDTPRPDTERFLRRIVRDSRGRTRIDLPLVSNADPLRLVEINDPANGVYFLL